MGFVGFLKFALNCFNLLAWPLFSLGCPLYASIRAIETNSNSDTRNLVAYWIIFSLISLFEHAFLKLIQWLPFWPYMKLMAICWLGLPHFNGACYVYECLIRPCLSVNPQVAINRFVEHKEDLPLNAESFLAMAERYVKENGSEALEKLMDRKSKHDTAPNIDMEEIKAVTNTEAKEMTASIQSFKEPNVAKEDDKVVEPKEKIPAVSIKGSKFKEPNVATENAEAGELEEKWNDYFLKMSFKEPNVAKEDDKVVEPKEKIPAASTQGIEGEREKEIAKVEVEVEVESLRRRRRQSRRRDQKRDSYTFLSRKHGIAFLTQNRHQSKFKEPNIATENAEAGELKEKNPAAATEQDKCVEEPNLAQTEKKPVAAREFKEKTVTSAVRENKAVEVPAATTGGRENKVDERPTSVKVQKEWTCAVCQVTTTSEGDLKSHLHGQKCKAKRAELKARKQANKNKKQEDKVTSEQCKQEKVKNNTSGSGVEDYNEYKLRCIICNVRCPSEVHMASHLEGKKHLSQVQQMMDSVMVSTGGWD